MKKVEFKSKDELLITADLYLADNPLGVIVLCHRSHSNRAEYREVAPKLNLLGYTCLAIDQRSGMKVFGEVNETKNRAKEQKLPTGYLNARPDIEAAIDFAVDLNGNKKIILLGSSYSASLALWLGVSSDKIKAILAFSPCECLKGMNLSKEIKNLKLPIFVACSRVEIEETDTLLRKLDDRIVTRSNPIEEGFHGSKILWESVKGYEKIWTDMKGFLSTQNQSSS